MSAQTTLVKATFAVFVALSLAACNEDKKSQSSTAPAEQSKTAEAVDAAKDAAKKAADAAGEKLEKAKEVVKDAAKDVAAKVEDVKEQAKAAANVAKEKVSEAVEAAKAKIEEAKPSEAPPAAEAKSETVAEKPVDSGETKSEASTQTAEAKPAETAVAAETKAEAPVEKPAQPAPAAASGEDNADNKAVQEAAKAAGVEFKDGRYRNKDGEPSPVVTKDYKVDWATWQGFRRYHDACHVCHGPNALGSTFAPSLGESLKTMDYATFYGTVVGGRIADRGGTKYVMPAFGEDKNIMCYLDDIYTYIKARSNNMATEGKEGMPAGRPAGREDISPEAKKAAADCTQ